MDAGTCGLAPTFVLFLELPHLPVLQGASSRKTRGGHAAAHCVSGLLRGDVGSGNTVSDAIATREEIEKKIRQSRCFQIDHVEKDLKPAEETGEILKALCEELLSFTLEDWDPGTLERDAGAR